MVWFLRGICKQCISRLYVYVIFKLSNPPPLLIPNEENATQCNLAPAFIMQPVFFDFKSGNCRTMKI